MKVATIDHLKQKTTTDKSTLGKKERFQFPTPSLKNLGL